MKDCWPFGIVLWGTVSNHHVLRWLKTVVVSDWGKAPLRRQVGTRKTYQSASLGEPEQGVVVEPSKPLDGIKTRGRRISPGTNLAGAR